MVFPLTILFGTLGYLYYKNKGEVNLNKNKISSEQDELKEDNLFEDLEDLFI